MPRQGSFATGAACTMSRHREQMSHSALQGAAPTLPEVAAEDSRLATIWESSNAGRLLYTALRSSSRLCTCVLCAVACVKMPAPTSHVTASSEAR